MVGWAESTTKDGFTVLFVYLYVNECVPYIYTLQCQAEQPHMFFVTSDITYRSKTAAAAADHTIIRVTGMAAYYTFTVTVTIIKF